MIFTHRIGRVILLCCLIISPLAHADKKDGNAKRLYRYYNEQGIPMVSDLITEEHVRRGYDIVDRNMQVLRHIPAFDEVAYAKDKAKRDAAFKQQQEDARILRLYSSARDAELARNRQLDTLETSIGYSSLQLIRLKRLRAEFVEDAAAAERKTQAPTQKTTAQISDYDKQIRELQTVIDTQKAEQEKVKNDFIPIIKRLTELETGDAGQSLPLNSKEK
jgi:hypothetical protein